MRIIFSNHFVVSALFFTVFPLNCQGRFSKSNLYGLLQPGFKQMQYASQGAQTIDKSAVIAYKCYDWIHSIVLAACVHFKPDASLELKGEEMRKLAALVAPILIIVIVLAAVGCGDGESATPTPGYTISPTVTAGPTLGPTVAPTATATLQPAPTQTPSGTEPPCRFYGNVQLDSADVPDGTVITIIVEGDEYETTTPAVYGPSTYARKVEPVSGSAYAGGTIVTFEIDGHVADQTGSWEMGGNIEINLTASTS